MTAKAMPRDTDRRFVDNAESSHLSSASSDFGFAVGLLQMSTEFVPHRGQELVGKVRLAPRTESLIKRRRENWGRHCFIDRSLNCPASFTRVGYVAEKP